MTAAKETKELSTEEKIKEAARTVFHKKGYAATRTRDIADEAGINLALLNYYFRSKEKLFQLIMAETMSVFFQQIVSVVNDKNTDLYQKIEQVANNYIDFLSGEPEVPLFILSELRNNPDALIKKLPAKNILLHSEFVEQYREAVEKGEVMETNPLQFLLSLMGMIIFPFVARPLLLLFEVSDAENFKQLMQERKKLIPIWIKTMMMT